MKNELKEKAIEMRKQGISIIKIGKELGVAKSSVSVWTRGITLTDEQRYNLNHIPHSNERTLAHSNIFRIKRQKFQNIGIEKIRNGEPLYVAGCMLYWGEGSKDKNSCGMVNSELPMLIVFKKFLLTYFSIHIDDISININAYTDLKSENDIKKYWLDGLGLPETSIKHTYWNISPSSSKNKNMGKLMYGTCTMKVHKTEIVQEIFGAIQEFGQFTNSDWLNGKPKKSIK